MIRVTSRIFFTSSVAPACLQRDIRDEDAQVSLIVTGWGATDPRNRMFTFELFLDFTFVIYFPYIAAEVSVIGEGGVEGSILQ